MNREMKWAHALLKYTEDQTEIVCQTCGSKDVSCSFQKNDGDNIGCAICRCNDCGDFFVLSRMFIPDWIKTDAVQGGAK